MHREDGSMMCMPRTLALVLILVIASSSLAVCAAADAPILQ
jgi:hypothetical protein